MKLFKLVFCLLVVGLLFFFTSKISQSFKESVDAVKDVKIVLEEKTLDFIKYSKYNNSLSSGDLGDFYVFEDDTYLRHRDFVHFITLGAESSENSIQGDYVTKGKLAAGEYDELKNALNEYMEHYYLKDSLRYKEFNSRPIHYQMFSIEFSFSNTPIRLESVSGSNNISIEKLYDMSKQLKSQQGGFAVNDYAKN